MLSSRSPRTHRLARDRAPQTPSRPSQRRQHTWTRVASALRLQFQSSRVFVNRETLAHSVRRLTTTVSRNARAPMPHDPNTMKIHEGDDGGAMPLTDLPAANSCSYIDHSTHRLPTRKHSQETVDMRTCSGVNCALSALPAQLLRLLAPRASTEALRRSAPLLTTSPPPFHVKLTRRYRCCPAPPSTLHGLTPQSATSSGRYPTRHCARCHARKHE